MAAQELCWMSGNIQQTTCGRFFVAKLEVSRPSCKGQRFKLINNENPLWMFPLACNLLKKDAYFNDFQKIFLAKNPLDCQISLNQIVASVNTMNHFHI